MGKQTYKFRVEHISEVTRFMEKAKFWYSIKVERCVWGKTFDPALDTEAVVEIATKEGIDKIIAIFKKIPSSHTMVETIQPKKLYTGVRTPRTI